MCPRSVESDSWIRVPRAPLNEGHVGRRGYPPEFRRKVLDLLVAGRSVVGVARDLETSPGSTYTRRRIDRGLIPGLSSAEKSDGVHAPWSSISGF